MKTFYNFLEFVANRNDIRDKVLDAIGANHSSDEDSKRSERLSLNSFEDRQDVLYIPSLKSMIDNEGAVLELLNRAETDDSITVGNLINLIANQSGTDQNLPSD